MSQTRLEPGTTRANKLIRLLAEYQLQLGNSPTNAPFEYPRVEDLYDELEDGKWVPNEYYGTYYNGFARAVEKVYDSEPTYESVPPTNDDPPKPRAYLNFHTDDLYINTHIIGSNIQITVNERGADIEDNILDLTLPEDFNVYEAIRYDLLASIARRANDYDQSVTNLVDYFAVNNPELETDANTQNTSPIKHWSDLRDRHYETIRENVRAVETAKETAETTMSQSETPLTLTDSQKTQIESLVNSVANGESTSGYLPLFDGFLTLAVFTVDTTPHAALTLHENRSLYNPDLDDTYPPDTNESELAQTHPAMLDFIIELRPLLEPLNRTRDFYRLDASDDFNSAVRDALETTLKPITLTSTDDVYATI